MRALCEVATEELRPVNAPRVYGLAKIVEISHFNMNRIRWARLLASKRCRRKPSLRLWCGAGMQEALTWHCCRLAWVRTALGAKITAHNLIASHHLLTGWLVASEHRSHSPRLFHSGPHICPMCLSNLQPPPSEV